MKNKYFLTNAIELREDFSRKIGDKAYTFLSEVNPQSIEQVPLVQTGVLLLLDEPISRFSSDEFIQAVELRLKQLGQYDWLRFNKVTGIPDTKPIEPVHSSKILGLISGHLSEHDWGEEGLPDDPRDQLRKLHFRLSLQNKICGLLNQVKLHESQKWLAAFTVNDNNPISIAYRDFHLSVTSLLEA